MKDVKDVISDLGLTKFKKRLKKAKMRMIPKMNGTKIFVSREGQNIIFQKRNKQPINPVDMISTDLYRKAVSRLNQLNLKSIWEGCVYEFVYVYEKDKLYLVSIKDYFEFYKKSDTIRAESQRLKCLHVPATEPAILKEETVDVIINDPQQILSILPVDTVLFTCPKYLSFKISKDLKEHDNQWNQDEYHDLVKKIIEQSDPDFMGMPLHNNDDKNLISLLCNILRSADLDVDISKLDIPEYMSHVEWDAFTTSHFYHHQFDFIKNRTNMVLFRILLLLIKGQGYDKDKLEDDELDKLDILRQRISNRLNNGISFEIPIINKI